MQGFDQSPRRPRIRKITSAMSSVFEMRMSLHYINGDPCQCRRTSRAGNTSASSRIPVTPTADRGPPDPPICPRKLPAIIKVDHSSRAPLLHDRYDLRIDEPKCDDTKALRARSRPAPDHWPTFDPMDCLDQEPLLVNDANTPRVQQSFYSSSEPRYDSAPSGAIFFGMTTASRDRRPARRWV